MKKIDPQEFLDKSLEPIKQDINLINLKMDYINECLGNSTKPAFEPITVSDLLGDKPLKKPNPKDFGIK